MTIIPKESLDDYFPREIVREIVQFKQHTFSRAFMVWIFSVLTYMHLPVHAREIRLFVYKTIKWHLLKLLLLIFFLNITIKNFYLCLFNSHIFSDFLDCLWYNKTLIYWLFGQQQVYCPPRHQQIVGVSGDNKLAIVLIASKQVYTID